MNVIAPMRSGGLGGMDFEEFFEREFTRLLRAVYLVTGDRYEAEEIAQEAMARACQDWPRVLLGGER